MIIRRNQKEVLNSTDFTTIYNFLMPEIKITNFKCLTNEITEEIKKFINSNDCINWKDATTKFSKLFNRSKTNQQLGYWLDRGWTEEEAKERISAQAKKAAKKANEAVQELKKDSEAWEKFKATKTTSLKYYTNKGFSESEAKEKLKERQATFSKEKLTELHGEKKAEKLLNARNSKWLSSLKKNNDWSELSKRKAMTLEAMIKKYGSTNGTEKYNNWYKSVTKVGTQFISKESINFFLPILKIFENEIDDSELYFGFGNSKEYWIKYNIENQSGIYFYDLTIRNLGLIIEYHGVHVHPNPAWDKEKWSSWKHAFNHHNADEIRKYDLSKKALAESQGFKVIEIWNDNAVEQNYELVISEIKKLL